MMKYDFESMIDRTGKDAIAVEQIPIPGAVVQEGFSKIPMWVADMNFATAPAIPKAMNARVEHPLYGYFSMPTEYYQSIIYWHKERYGASDLTPECIGYENGVLGGVVTALQAFTAPGEAILIHSPTYIGFTGILNNNGREIVHSDLVQDSDGVWRIDYEDMDRKIKEKNIHLAIFCAPHNPVGRVWTREELEKVMDIYRRNDVIVVSDEIWCDLTLFGKKHIPLSEVNEDARMRTISIYAPSKTFNLAGLVGSYHIIYNPYLRDRFRKVSSLSHYNSPNILSVHALIGAFNAEGLEWRDQLVEVLSNNAEYAYGYIRDHFKGIELAKPEGTYMIYLNCKEWCETHKTDMDTLLKAGVACGVIWQDGRPFNRPYAIRMNLAVPHTKVVEALDRLDRFVFNKK